MRKIAKKSEKNQKIDLKRTKIAQVKRSEKYKVKIIEKKRKKRSEIL
jgi:hypothetical protein